MRCTGYVSTYASATSADGFLVEVIPKESVKSVDIEVPSIDVGESESDIEAKRYFVTF